MNKPNLLPLSEFYDRYLPLENGEGLYLFDRDRHAWHGTVLEATPITHLWSYCTTDVDDSVFITPGFATVNALGVVLATVARTTLEEEHLQFHEELADEYETEPE